jgi:D-alanine-D-alanine ligase
MHKMGLTPVEDLTNDRSAWTWQTNAGLDKGTLVVVTLDSPIEQGRFPIPFRREPEWLHGEAIASSRAGIVCALTALGALRSVRRLKGRKLGLFAYTDEGRGMRYSAGILRRAAVRAGEVVVMSPGAREGKVVTQRRGLKKFSFVVEGDPMRIGARGERTDVLNWFLTRASTISALSRSAKKLTASVQDVRTERFSVLMPHRISATVGLTFLDPRHAEAAEAELREIVKPDQKHLQVRLEVLEERPPLRKRPDNPIVERLASLSEGWKLPFGTDSSLLASAAGCIPADTPVVCGMGPPGRDLYTPSEAAHRGELLQRSLLLALLLGGFE